VPEGQKLRVVGNLPYNISSPLLFHLAEFAHLVEDQHFMLQKEVVERMVAEPGTKAYSRLSVMLQWRYDMSMMFVVPPTAFDPPPRVDSAIVRMVPTKRQLPADAATLEAVVAKAFSQRRKVIRNCVAGMFTEAQLCITTSATTQARQRVGAQPLRWLFETTARRWIAQDETQFLFHGLNVLAMDGTTLRLADSEANRSHFGAQNYPNDKVASYPQARGVTLMMLATALSR
jgi:hypothetical protein